MKSPNTLFVTACIDLHIPHEEHKTIDMRVENFEKLARSGVPIALFTSKKYVDRMMKLVEAYPNVRIHKVVEIEDTLTYKQFEPYRDHLPPVRYAIKDKFEFLTLMNAKLEFMRDVMDTYGNTFPQYSWIDFNIWYIFKHSIEITKRLWFYATHILKHEGVYIPGCWHKGREADLLWNRINWRFCGGFFMGNAASVRDFIDVYTKNISAILEEKKVLTWEVNIWSHLENQYGWVPKWYTGDHNESMIHVPMEDFEMPEVDGETVIHYNERSLQVLCKNQHAKSGKYLLPPVPGFEPTSPSFVTFHDANILNVRYVNYILTPQGSYIIRHREGHLYTKNMCVMLDRDCKVSSAVMMEDKPTGLVTRHPIIEGIEDIRLFDDGGVLKFIATQREFSQENVNRMILGEYDVDTQQLCNAKVIEPPEFTGCEKNWIPIHRNGRLHFIYKWYPLQIGEIEKGGSRLIIREEFALPSIFERMRGSSGFVKFEDSLVGVIHYSEEGAPRKYFHALVWLEKETGRPTHMSDIFIFNKLGIEFCIGFTVEVVEDVPFARFWFSQHDRDPMWLCIPMRVITKYQV